MTINLLSLILSLLLMSVSPGGFAQGSNVPAAEAVAKNRVSFLLKNTLGYHRMFRVEGPTIAYGFTMNRKESTPKNWPVGSKLYFSDDGETNGALILTVSAADEGKTLTTGTAPAQKPIPKVASQAETNTVAIRLYNPRFSFRKVALISYAPAETGNATVIFTIAPKTSRLFSFPVGTKLYLADDEQVKTVMSGRRIDSEKPFMVVEKEDRGRLVNMD